VALEGADAQLGEHLALLAGPHEIGAALVGDLTEARQHRPLVPGARTRQGEGIVGGAEPLELHGAAHQVAQGRELALHVAVGRDDALLLGRDRHHRVSEILARQILAAGPHIEHLLEPEAETGDHAPVIGPP